jgi:TorA maturation chaperone TorD
MADSDKNRINILKGYNLLLYFAGSMIMSEPTEECIIDFWANGSLKKLPISSSNHRFMIASALLRCSCEDKDLCRKTLSEDYYRLFEQNGLPMAPAFESLYVSKFNDSGKSVQSVSEFYESYGWKPKTKNSVPGDHLGIELLFLTRLVEMSLHLDDEPSHRELKKEIRRFIDQHILSWIPEWNKKVQESAHTSCYKGIGTLIHACVEDIYGFMS